jgi:hypothetical protein
MLLRYMLIIRESHHNSIHTKVIFTTFHSHFTCSRPNISIMTKVALLGAAGQIGTPLSLLLKTVSLRALSSVPNTVLISKVSIGRRAVAV